MNYDDKRAAYGGAAIGVGLLLSLIGLALWINHCQGPLEQEKPAKAAPK